MTFISIILASAGMSLALVGPDGAAACKDECAKECCVEKEAGPCCALGEAAEKDVKSTMDQAHKHLPQVDPALYVKADWPAYNKGESLYAKDLQGKALPVKLGKETWISKKTNLEGKVVVLDFWATWCPPCRSALPILNKMQLADTENLAIVAIGGQREDEQTVRSFVEEHNESISNLFDPKQAVYNEFESQGIPLVVVMSTDGVIRWIGNPHDANFKKAVAQVIKVDPLINAKS